MKAREIRDLALSDVAMKLAEARDEYSKMKLNHAVSPLENPAKIKELRRTIARLNTILCEMSANTTN